MKTEQLIERIDDMQQSLMTLLQKAGKMPVHQKTVLDQVLKGLKLVS